MRILSAIVQAHIAEQVIVQCVLGLIVLHEAHRCRCPPIFRSFAVYR